MPKTFTVVVRKRGKDPRQWFSEVTTQIYPELQNEIVLSAEATAEIMREILLNSGYKLDKLADAIQADFPKTKAGVIGGIGRINDMPKGIAGNYYYEAFNEGFKVIQANIGFFTSGSGMSGDKSKPISGESGLKWIHTGKGSPGYLMQPNKIIEPLKYIDIGYVSFLNRVQLNINKFYRSLDQASN